MPSEPHVTSPSENLFLLPVNPTKSSNGHPTVNIDLGFSARYLDIIMRSLSFHFFLIILVHPHAKQLAVRRFKSNANLPPQTGHFKNPFPSQFQEVTSVLTIMDATSRNCLRKEQIETNSTF